MTSPSSFRAIAIGLFGYLCWGLFPLYWKQLKQVPAAEVLSHRIFWSSLLLISITMGRGRTQDLTRIFFNWKVLRWFLLSSMLIGFNWYLYIWGVNSGFVLETSLGYFINPLFSVVIGVTVLREKLSRPKRVAILLAAAAVTYLTLAYGQVPWIALGLACSFSLYALCRKLAPAEAIAGLTAETSLLAPLAFIYWNHMRSQGLDNFGYHLGDSVYLIGAGVATSLPLICFVYAARLLPLSTMGILQFLSPTCQFLLAVFVFGEPFTQTHLGTFGTIWIAIAVYLWALWQERPTSTRAT